MGGGTGTRKTLADYVMYGGLAGRKFIDRHMEFPDNIYEISEIKNSGASYLVSYPNGLKMNITLDRRFDDLEATPEEVKRAKESRLARESQLDLKSRGIVVDG